MSGEIPFPGLLGHVKAMVRTGKWKKSRAGVLLLLFLCGLGPAGLVLPKAAESRVIKGGVATAWVRQYNNSTGAYLNAVKVDGLFLLHPQIWH